MFVHVSAAVKNICSKSDTKAGHYSDFRPSWTTSVPCVALCGGRSTGFKY